jgi:VanZ family protein
MPDQPWRNPRPAPQFNQVQPRLGRLLVPQWLRSWWPAFLWAAVIFTFSTDLFSAQHTAKVIEAVLHWLVPSLTHHQLAHIHFFIRKCAHFTEYFVFCVLLYRGIRGPRLGWHWSWAFAALIIAACYSVLDEIHQAFIHSRTASPWDSLLDSSAAFLAVLALYLWFRLRKGTPRSPLA